MYQLNGKQQRSSKLNNNDIDKLFTALIRWNPKIRRDFKQIDPFLFLIRILERLAERNPSTKKSRIRVWSNLIERLARHAKRDESKWTSVQRAFRMLWIAYPDCRPARKLLKIGMMASEATSDAELAAELISHEVAHIAPSLFDTLDSTNAVVDGFVYSNSIDFADADDESDDYPNIDNPFSEPSSDPFHAAGQSDSRAGQVTTAPVSPISFHVFKKALSLCARTGDVESNRIVLHSFEKVRSFFPLSKQADLYGLALLGYAQAGHADTAASLLDSMENKQMNPR